MDVCRLSRDEGLRFLPGASRPQRNPTSRDVIEVMMKTVVEATKVVVSVSHVPVVLSCSLHVHKILYHVMCMCAKYNDSLALKIMIQGGI